MNHPITAAVPVNPVLWLAAVFFLLLKLGGTREINHPVPLVCCILVRSGEVLSNRPDICSAHDRNWCIWADIPSDACNWCCWSADALLLLMRWCCWCTDAANMLLLQMCWCCWCADAADALMLLMRWCCLCADAADGLMLLYSWCY